MNDVGIILLINIIKCTTVWSVPLDLALSG